MVWWQPGQRYSLVEDSPDSRRTVHSPPAYRSVVVMPPVTRLRSSGPSSRRRRFGRGMSPSSPSPTGHRAPPMPPYAGCSLPRSPDRRRSRGREVAASRLGARSPSVGGPDAQPPVRRACGQGFSRLRLREAVSGDLSSCLGAVVRRPPTPDTAEELAQVIVEQFGVVSWDQCLASGMTRKAIQVRLETTAGRDSTEASTSPSPAATTGGPPRSQPCLPAVKRPPSRTRARPSRGGSPRDPVP
jgi:hypothetical protein